jgi:hypothetical protein
MHCIKRFGAALLMHASPSMHPTATSPRPPPDKAGTALRVHQPACRCCHTAAPLLVLHTDDQLPVASQLQPHRSRCRTTERLLRLLQP